MADVISVRLDGDAQRALAELEAAGMSRSEAVRFALRAGASHLRDRGRLATEAAALADDPEDREEAGVVTALMEDLREAW